MNYSYPPALTLLPERISRTTYFVRGILFLIGSAVACGIMSVGGSHHHHHIHLLGLPFVLVGALMLLACFVALFKFVLVPRLRDIGLESPWLWSLLFFVHALSFFFLVALLFLPTDSFADRRSTYPRYY